jgi:hypothetical protein
MFVTVISFSQPGFIELKMQWNTTICDKEAEYKWPSFCQRLLLPSTFSTILCWHLKSLIELIICLLLALYIHAMSMNGSPPKTTSMAAPGGLYGSQQGKNDKQEASDCTKGNAWSKDIRFGQPTNQFILHQCIVTSLCSHHFQALLSSTTIPH